MTKDRDFVLLVETLGPPPQVVWITCGNTSNERLREVLRQSFPKAMELLLLGERIVEISDLP
jgi:predicted nuclease of predicted toxin-antitoxin system